MNEQFKSIETTELVKIANAIRVKTGSNEQIALEDMPDKIRSIEGGGIYLPELEFEGSSTDLLAGKQLIDSEGNIITGTIPTKTNNSLTIEGANITVPKGYYETDVVAEVPTTTQATPTISTTSTGKITATVSQSAGYIEAGTKTATHQLDVQAAQTITPSTSDKTIAAGKYLTGTQTIKGDANLKAANIAEGVSIFGVVGTHAGDSGGVVLPTLTNEGAASDLLSGKQLIDGDGKIVEGTIATKTASDLTVSGATVTMPSGYYATQATKSVATATRANTTISTTADDTNDKLTITASNNQTTGYVTGENKTASTTISLSASGATVTASDGTNKISKSVATATQATPSVSINSSGLITASATQSAGYVSAGTKSGTKQLTTQAAKTITPSTSSQTAVASGVYTTGAVTVAAIPSSYKNTSDATASADEIMQGETAYVNGSKVTGTFTIDEELETQDDLIAQISSVVNSLPEAGSGGGSGGGKICSVTLDMSGCTATMMAFVQAWYISSDNIVSPDVLFNALSQSTATFEAQAGLLVIDDVMTSGMFYQSPGQVISGDASLAMYNGLTMIFHITGDCTIKLFA